MAAFFTPLTNFAPRSVPPGFYGPVNPGANPQTPPGFVGPVDTGAGAQPLPAGFTGGINPVGSFTPLPAGFTGGSVLPAALPPLSAAAAASIGVGRVPSDQLNGGGGAGGGEPGGGIAGRFGGMGFAIGAASWTLGGPFDVGSTADPHKLGADADGTSVNALHIRTAALFKGTGGDGPLDFDSAAYKPLGQSADGSIIAPVFLRWNKAATHPFQGGIKPGLWQWQTEIQCSNTSSTIAEVLMEQVTYQSGGGAY